MVRLRHWAVVISLTLLVLPAPLGAAPAAQQTPTLTLPPTTFILFSPRFFGVMRLSAVLLDADNTGIVGREVTFTLANGELTLTCTTGTDFVGEAICEVPSAAWTAVDQPLGPAKLTATFAGDAEFSPVSTTGDVLLYDALVNEAKFVIGDQSATGSVTFWSAQWAQKNRLSNGQAPSSYNGFPAGLADLTDLLTCRGEWRDIDFLDPPPTIPSYMAVIVSSTIPTIHGTQTFIGGDVFAAVIVKTDPGYAPDVEHEGTGTVVGVLCSH